MSGRRLITTAAVLAAAAALSGCGVTDPYTNSSTATSLSAASTSARTATTARRATTTAADAQDPVAERGGTIPARNRRALGHVNAGAAQPTARTAVELYARLYTNWRIAELAGVQRHLAQISIGPAREAAAQQAASIATQTTLRTDRVANTGQVVSAQSGLGPERGRWVVVTREQTTGRGPYRGLPWQLHVTVATVTHTRHGWVISQWSPQT
jgi:hypothetical protein